MAPHAELSNEQPTTWEAPKVKSPYNGHTAAPVESAGPAKTISDTISSAYKILERPIGSRRALRVVCMGAGYSGLMMAILFNEKMKNSNASLAVYEKNVDIGGTWLENRYPGCRCDIPA